MLTLTQARQLPIGTTLFCKRSFNRQGQPHKVKITSIKTWKTRPNEILIGYKHGLYTYGKITQYDLADFALTESEALDARAA